MASQKSFSANVLEQSRTRQQRYSIPEVIEMLQTEGSDIEEEDDETDESDSSEEFRGEEEIDTDSSVWSSVMMKVRVGQFATRAERLRAAKDCGFE